MKTETNKQGENKMMYTDDSHIIEAEMKAEAAKANRDQLRETINTVAARFIEEVTSRGKSHLRFLHEDGKWYVLSVKATSKEDKFVVSRVFGGEHTARPGKLTRVESSRGVRSIISSRFQHGYILQVAAEC